MKTILSTLLVLSMATAAHAEKADARKETTINSQHATFSSVKDAGSFSGNIELTRGSLVMRGEKLDFEKNPNGYQNFVLVGTQGKKASFRQKSDNGDDEWIEGEGARIEYSDQSEEMKIFSNARLRRINAGKVVEEVEGEAIVYDSLKEFFSATNTPTGVSVPGGQRVKVVIQSRQAQAQPAAGGTKKQ